MESQIIEYKQSWRDEFLKEICGFANAQGGTLYIGVDDKGKAVGLQHAKKLLKDIPNTECGLFEINIQKDKETELMIENGYVAIYSAPEQAAPDTIIYASIAFV